MDLLDLLAVQGTLKSLLQHHSPKASLLWCSAFFILQLSHPYMTTGKTIVLTRWTCVDKGSYSQSYGFSSSYVQMWELDHKEGWALKNWCFPTVVLKKTLESPLNKEIKPVSPRGNQSWILIDAPILWLPDAKSRLIGKDPDGGKVWKQKKRVAENKMVK